MKTMNKAAKATESVVAYDGATIKITLKKLFQSLSKFYHYVILLSIIFLRMGLEEHFSMFFVNPIPINVPNLLGAPSKFFFRIKK